MRKAQAIILTYFVLNIWGNANNIEELIQKGVLQLENQKYEQAAEIFSEILEKFPQNQDVVFLLGKSQLKSGKIQDGVATFEKFLKLSNSFASYWNEAVQKMQDFANRFPCR